MITSRLYRQGSRRSLLLAVALALTGMLVFRWAPAFTGIDDHRQLPGSVFSRPDLGKLGDVSIEVVDRNGNLLRAYLTGDQTWRMRSTPAEVDPQYLMLLKSYEDVRFERHGGVDWPALARAVGQSLTSLEFVSGASTLSMQTARLLSPADRTLLSKLREIRHAWWLERHRSKEEILSMYLTLAPFGGNLEGVRTASLAWFGKPADILTLGEAALLVALPKNPNGYRPDRHPRQAQLARTRVLQRALGRGLISTSQMEQALQEPLPLERRAFPFRFPHITDLALRRQSDNGNATSIIHTTIDGDMSDSVRELVRPVLGLTCPGSNAAAFIVEAATGDILSYVQAADYFHGRSRASMTNLSEVRRSPGSTLKPFVYGLAYDAGIAHPQTVIRDSLTSFAGYVPKNFSREFAGDIRIEEALVRSLNIPAIAVLAELGPQRFDTALRDAGVSLQYGDGNRPSLALGLGGGDLRFTDLVRLYVGLGRGGQVPDRLRLMAQAAPVGFRQMLSSRASWQIIETLRRSPVVSSSTSLKRRHPVVALKTGTSHNYRDAWALGLVGDYVVGIWVGNPDTDSCDGRTGSNTAVPLFQKIAALLPTSHLQRTGADKFSVARDYNTAPEAVRYLGDRIEGTLTLNFPLPDSRLLWQPGRAIPIRAEGGQPPYVWRINGRVLGASRNAAYAWQPTEPGFQKIQVHDQSGQFREVQIRIDDGGVDRAGSKGVLRAESG